ncbi:hypothetical protein ACQP2Y_35865 [Actinoplanes sp. CA-051413]|uniref:hypothetical protein n=1 Tax=Actinoplanes sp. CA-051413 TaxID=3239899 RepID=UPI003D98B321
MSGYIAGGIAIGTALLIAALVIRRGRARRGRDQLLRRAARATGQIHRDARRARRETIRGTGTGVNSRPNSAAMLGNDGPVGLP